MGFEGQARQSAVRWCGCCLYPALPLACADLSVAEREAYERQIAEKEAAAAAEVARKEAALAEVQAAAAAQVAEAEAQLGELSQEVSCWQDGDGRWKCCCSCWDGAVLG